MKCYRVYFKMTGCMTVDAEDEDEANEVIQNTPYVIAAKDVDELEVDGIEEDYPDEAYDACDDTGQYGNEY